MEKGSNRILAYKLAVTIYNLNQHSITEKIYFFGSESTKFHMLKTTESADLKDLTINL